MSRETGSPLPVDSAPAPPRRPPPSGRGSSPLPAIRDELLDEIHDYSPAWYVRWGAALVLALLGLLCAAASVVRYPEVVSAPVTLSSRVVPVRIAVSAGARVERVLVREKEVVAPGTPLVVLESPASYDDVRRAASWLDAGNAGAALPARLSLGPAQDEYVALQNEVEKLNVLLRDRSRAEMARLLTRQLAARDQNRGLLRDQRRAAADAQAIAQAKVERERKLMERMAGSPEELDRARAQLADRELGALRAEASIVEAEVERSEVQREVLRIQHEVRTEEESARQGVLAAARRLRGEIERWDAEHVLRAPIHGVATFMEPVQRGRVFAAAREVLAVAPRDQPVEGTMLVPESGIGKVRVGMPVRIALTSYPSRDYGSVHGRIRDISLVPGPEGYLATLELPRGLTTAFGRPLAVRQQMTGEGEVVVGEASLLGRMVGSLKLARERHLSRQGRGAAPVAGTAGAP